MAAGRAGVWMTGVILSIPASLGSLQFDYAGQTAEMRVP